MNRFEGCIYSQHDIPHSPTTRLERQQPLAAKGLYVSLKRLAHTTFWLLEVHCMHWFTIHSSECLP